MKRLYGNEDGATSVLVVFMMIVLVTLGTFAISSALVNRRFAIHASDWNKMLYALENQAERYVMDVDAAIAAAEQKAALYMAGGGYAMPAYAGIPNELQHKISQAYATSGRDEAALNNALAGAYNAFVVIELSGLQEKRPEQVLEVSGEEGGLNRGVEVSMTFASEKNPDAHLTVKLRARSDAPAYRIISVAEDAVTIQPDGSSRRYDVLEWRQWQTPVLLEEEHDVWDPLDGGAMPANPNVPAGSGIFDG